MDQLQYYLDLFKLHPNWAIAIVFLIAFGEALLIIGLFVPSTVVLVGAGTLVGTGHLGFWPVFIATAVGAIAGDQVSYWAGRFYGERLKTLWPLNRYPALLARGEDYVRQHGGKSIAIGRFVPGVKAVVPGIVGMFRMNQPFFVLVNFTSGIVWAAAHVFPGILLGQGLSFAGELSGRLVVVLLVLLGVLAVGGWLMRLTAAGLSPYLDRVLRRMSNYAKRFRNRPMQRLGRVLAPDHPRSYLTFMFIVFLFMGVAALIEVVSGLILSQAVSNFDISIRNMMASLRSSPGDDLMVGLSMLGSDFNMAVMGVLIVGWLIVRRARRAAIIAAVFLIVTRLSVLALKFTTVRPRPDTDLPVGVFETYSFPSTNVAMATVVFGVVALLLSQALGRWSRALVLSICGLLVLSIGFSQLYLGVHWLSDVLSGFLLGAIFVAGYSLAIEAIPARRINPAAFSVLVTLVFVGAASLHFSQSFAQQVALYKEPEKSRTVELQQYLTPGANPLPIGRVDLVGARSEPFVAQWIGGLDQLSPVLARTGWVNKPGWTWKDGIDYLNPGYKLDELQPRPMLHEGLRARLTAVKGEDKDANARFVLRVFQTDTLVRENERSIPAYLVSIVREDLPSNPTLYALPRFSAVAPEVSARLIGELQVASGVVELAKLDRPFGQVPILAADQR